MAYVERYGQNARALIHYCGYYLCLDKSTSRRVFDILLFDDNEKLYLLFSHIVKAHFVNFLPYSQSILFNTGHYGLEKKRYKNTVIRKKLKAIYFLHDIIPLTHPEHCAPGRDLEHHRRLSTMIDTGCGLILNSEDTKRILLSYSEKHNLSLPELLVAPLGTKTLLHKNLKKPLEEPYFVMLSRIESRKNHLLILNCWRRLVEEKITPMPKLVLIGQRGWECEQVVDMLERCAVLKDHVIEISNSDDDMLCAWLSHSRALLLPTFVEGYGLPLVEALSLNVPVIASNLNVFHEIAGLIPEYLDPIDGLGWYEMIRDYTQENSEKRYMQLNRARSFKQWTWDDHFALVDDFLERVIA